ncbi:MAG: calcium/proton exchanger [Acidobacteria bacterium]|nr:calcium/proton exchanger [Acidobacteriota bacterium]MBI3664182.1 calcium/proton exchanger [Acidobacteriota bacterium]
MWAEIRRYLLSRYLNVLLVFVPGLLLLEYLHVGAVWLFAASALAIVPLAGVLGDATEEVAARLGPAAGGLLSGTLGNATELIIALMAIRAGEIAVVKASITGSILGNLLLVFGLSVLAGGMGRVKQTFERTHAGVNTAMLMLAVVGLVMPAVFDLVVYGTLERDTPLIQNLSLATSGVLIATYLASFLFSFRTHKHLFQAEEHHASTMSPKTALTLLIGATLLIAWSSEVLVGQIEGATKALGMTKFFVGVIVVAVVGNAAEHSAAVVAARKNKMDLSLTIAVGSSVQIALLVAPLLVFASHALGHPMSLVFNGFEIVSVILSVLVVSLVAMDGETNWFEGVQLLAVYLILAIAFFFVPA